jgi:hypothetical protein
MAGRMLSATRGRRRESAKKLIHELIDVAFQAIDESFVRSHLLAAARGDHRVVTRGAIAASLFVRNGEMALRKLLPDVDPDKIEDGFRLRLDEVCDGPDRKRNPQAAALEDLWMQRDLAARMVYSVLAA